MLAELQRHLTDIYQADCGHRVTDFLITDRTLASVLGAARLDESVEETVLVAEDDGGLSMSVYLDQALLARVAATDPMRQLDTRHLRDLSVVLEGISHFNYLGWCAQQDKSVTLLELELQAEIDKYVATSLLAHAQNERELARELHGHLFGNVSFRPSMDADERARYETANDYAARFCHRGRQKFDDELWLRELRWFYRLTQPEKFSYIHSLVWRT